MSQDQFYTLLFGAACFLAAQIVVWGCFAAYLVLTGRA